MPQIQVKLDGVDLIAAPYTVQNKTENDIRGSFAMLILRNQYSRALRKINRKEILITYCVADANHKYSTSRGNDGNIRLQSS